MRGIWAIYLFAGFVPYLILAKLPDHLIKWVNINVSNELKIATLGAMVLWLIAFFILGVRELYKEEKADKEAKKSIDAIGLNL